ncbi:MBL fold metallo-hydrolase [Bdellovibrio svalbardensis]|uniref:MBL fold metallo-hydrolase n=1 Tax=Bdellovibrio svalbardensis TaxID=2972972 RepID=A0ABT6DE89_9BACT|nr:MBL fold metallo-hydrolase [Bdellovibrio svalbardensis]MDG0815156.1 MBL fold metallo-hydrolase [Bdellovibrio svalbardensis]
MSANQTGRNLKISRILHAGYVFECDQTQIAFDTIFENPFSRNCHAFPNVRFDHEQIRNLKLDAVFISHFHDDHCSFESLDFLDRKTPIYVYCLFEELFALIKELGFVNVHPLQIDVPVVVGAIEIIPRRALDSDVDSMFQIKAAGLNVLNVVDSWIDYSTLDELARMGPWDMVMWPFQTMREIEVIAPSRATAATGELPVEWVEQLTKLKPRYIVPSSCQFVLEDWSWYNQAFFPISYRQFQKEIESALPDSQVVRLNPSVSVTLDQGSLQQSSPLPWVLPVGDQDVDYDYRPELPPPRTAEIAQHFEPLTAQQTERVYEYCRVGLIEKYQLMDPPADMYFEKPRMWQLSVYDHKGEVRIFRYRLDGSSIEALADTQDPLSWTTEVPISKLYAALELGESLTSMYMRINDMVFAPEIEKEIQDADIVDDPLIRCLFNGFFGSYQIAQLKRIKAREHAEKF